MRPGKEAEAEELGYRLSNSTIIQTNYNYFQAYFFMDDLKMLSVIINEMFQEIRLESMALKLI